MARRQLRGFRLPPGFLVGYFPWPPRDAPLQTPPSSPCPGNGRIPPRNATGAGRDAGRRTQGGRRTFSPCIIPTDPTQPL